MPGASFYLHKLFTLLPSWPTHSAGDRRGLRIQTAVYRKKPLKGLAARVAKFHRYDPWSYERLHMIQCRTHTHTQGPAPGLSLFLYSFTLPFPKS